MQRVTVRLLASVGTASLLTLVLYRLVPDTLDPDLRTDIVGLPTFANFNAYQYQWKYALAVVLFPLATLGMYVALTRLAGRRLFRSGPLPPPVRDIEARPEVEGWRVWPVALGRTLVVGVAFGLEAAIWVDEHAWAVVIATAVAYSAVAVVAGGAWARLGHRAPDAIGTVNAFAAPFLVAGLYGVSQATRITVQSTGVEHAYRWLPAWVAFGATAALLVAVAVALFHGRWRLPAGSVERGVLLLLVVPVVLFVFVADLPGELGTVDLYEEGQILAGAELTRDGAFPWRDLLVTHGLLHDVGQGIVGFELFEDSRWGLVAGELVVLVPLAWVAVYYLSAYLLWANWLILAGTQLLIVTGHVSEVQVRLLLLPVTLLLLAALLQRATVPRAAAFTSVLALQVIVTPEALVAVLACFGTLAAFELYYFRRASGMLAFRRLLYCGATAVVLGCCWLVFLAANHALDDWVFSFAATIPGHALTGAIPILVSRREFEIVATLVLLLGTFAFVVVRTLEKRPLAYRDWLMVGMAGVSLLYFTKFLSRADRYHLDQAFFVTIPLLFYAGYRAITFGEASLASIARARGLRHFPRRHTLTAPLLAVLIAVAPLSLIDEAKDAPDHFEAAVASEPELERIGYARPGENDVAAIRALGRTLATFLGPDATIFDFSNAPGLFHYLLDLPPSTRYYHVSYAIRQRTQTDLVRALQRRPPGAVVLTSNGIPTSPSTWDGIVNPVRHYDVSSFLLDRYVPVVDLAGFVLARPRSEVQSESDLYFTTRECDWGYVPNFFAPAPDKGAASRSLKFERSSGGTQLVVTLPPDAAGYTWLELQSRTPLAPARFEMTDAPDAADARRISFDTLPGRQSVRVMVGACSQWHGYRPGPLYLTTSAAQDVQSVRLVR